MNEDSHVPRGPDTGHERVLTQRRGNGGDGAVADARIVSDNTCQTASRGLARSLKPVFTRGEVLATVYSLMGLAVGLRCGGNV